MNDMQDKSSCQRVILDVTGITTKNAIDKKGAAVNGMFLAVSGNLECFYHGYLCVE